MRDAILDGLEAIDWGSMYHACGPASDVPDLLRGLLSADVDEREAALNNMVIGVHRQGDVYGCTIACIPFLLVALADPDIPDRHEILSLAGSIGGADLNDEEFAWLNDLEEADARHDIEDGPDIDFDDSTLISTAVKSCSGPAPKCAPPLRVDHHRPGSSAGRRHPVTISRNGSVHHFQAQIL